MRGAGVTLFSQTALFAIQMISTVVLARLLTPSDFGLVTMVTTFSLLLVNFGLNGFTEAVVQREAIDHGLASNLFWINLAIGLVFTFAFAAAGSLLAHFYRNTRVAGVAVGMSLTILLTSLSVLHLALMKRAMRFALVSANDIVSRAISVAVSVLLAWLGAGYWALVAGAIAQPLTTTIGAWLFCAWMPGLPRRVPGTGSAVRFALNTYGNFSVNYFSRNTDNLLVGWLFNAQSLGFYKKAYDLFALSASQVVSPLTVVALSTLSRLKPDSIQYRRYLLRSLSLVAFVGMGLGGDLTLVGKDVIRLLLGPGWEPAGRIFTFFGPGIGVMLLYGTHGWIHLSIGRADRWFRWAIVEFAVTLLLFIFGLHWGPVGIAAAWTVSFYLLTLPAFWYAGKPINLPITPIIATVWRYVTASLLAGSITMFLLRQWPALGTRPGSLGAFFHIVLISLLFGCIYLGAIILFYQGCAPVYRVSDLLREMFLYRRFSGRSSAAVTN